MPDNVTNKIIEVMRDLYFDAPNARSLLMGIGYQQAQIPEFHSAATFWPPVILRLSNGIVENGTARLLTAAAKDHPGNTQLSALLGQAGAPAASAPERTSVLCLFADPVRTSKIRIDREARLMGLIDDQGRIDVTMRHAVRVTDIIRAIVRERPRILHFAGHGTIDGDLLFEDDRGGAAFVGLDRLAQAIIAVTDGPLDCVVLNSCFTGANAEAFRGATRAVAGSVTAVKDDCAMAFARGFYTAINEGLPVAKAYRAGRAEAGLAECDTDGFMFVSFPVAAGEPG
ncbi:CHAT domain-containing protein [Amycolatopsis sp. NPDC004747]